MFRLGTTLNKFKVDLVITYLHYPLPDQEVFLLLQRKKQRYSTPLLQLINGKTESLQECFSFSASMYFKNKKQAYMPKFLKIEIFSKTKKGKALDEVNLDLSTYCLLHDKELKSQPESDLPFENIQEGQTRFGKNRNGRVHFKMRMVNTKRQSRQGSSLSGSNISGCSDLSDVEKRERPDLPTGRARQFQEDCIHPQKDNSYSPKFGEEHDREQQRKQEIELMQQQMAELKEHNQRLLRKMQVFNQKEDSHHTRLLEEQLQKESAKNVLLQEQVKQEHLKVGEIEQLREDNTRLTEENGHLKVSLKEKQLLNQQQIDMEQQRITLDLQYQLEEREQRITYLQNQLSLFQEQDQPSDHPNHLETISQLRQQLLQQEKDNKIAQQSKQEMEGHLQQIKGIKADLALLEDKQRQKEQIRKSVLYEENLSLREELQNLQDSLRCLQESHHQVLVDNRSLEETRHTLVQDKQDQDQQLSSLRQDLARCQSLLVEQKSREGALMNVALGRGEAGLVEEMMLALQGRDEGGLHR